MQHLLCGGATSRDVWRRHLFGAMVGIVALVVCGTSLTAQTDYYNTDAGRPLRIEDALVIERYALELQAAPFAIERSRGGHYAWSIEPEIAWGPFPYTQIEIAFPLRFREGAGRQTGGLAGIEASLAYALNTETRTLPAIAVRGGLVAPVGHLAPPHALGSLGVLVTRTTGLGRLHLNGAYTIGPMDEETTGTPASAERHEADRWLAGAAVDHAFAVRSLLLGAELYASSRTSGGSDVAWNAGIGLRYQANPRFALDAGVGRSFGDDRTWRFTLGSAYAFALPFLMPSTR